MPFNAPFRRQFQAGDLIYGLATTRTALVIEFGVDIINSGGLATVDQFRKSMAGSNSPEQKALWKNFLSDNEIHPKYGRYMRHIRAFNNDEEYFAENTSALKQNDAWRAKSKFGMEWTISQQRGHIHFVLDEIDIGAVVTKTHRYEENGQVLAQDLPRGKSTSGESKERTITHSELRWIYRNRNNPLVQAQVQFWLTTGGRLTPCVAPWENSSKAATMPSGSQLTWQNAWKVYRPRLEPVDF